MISSLTLSAVQGILAKLQEVPFKATFQKGEFQVAGENYAKPITVFISRQSSPADSSKFAISFPNEIFPQDSYDKLKELAEKSA